MYGLLTSIVSDGDPKFTSRFWKGFHYEMGTRLNHSTSNHHESDEKMERTIQAVEDMLWACILEKGGSWNFQLPLIELSYNNNYHSSIIMELYEALYGRKCRISLCWAEIKDKGIIIS